MTYKPAIYTSNAIAVACLSSVLGLIVGGLSIAYGEKSGADAGDQAVQQVEHPLESGLFTYHYTLSPETKMARPDPNCVSYDYTRLPDGRLVVRIR